MNYWHMQLHPSKLNWGREKELLEKESLIGLGEWIKGSSQINSFKNTMKIGDIVLIKRGSIPIALVEVTGDYEYDSNGTTELAWFSNRRSVNVLAFSTDKSYRLAQARGTLQKSIGKKTQMYQYIHSWYNRVLQTNYNKAENSLGSYKISHFYIDKFKILNKLKINLINTNHNPLPIVILAGKNGVGKTSILKFLADCNLSQSEYITVCKVRSPNKFEAKFDPNHNVIVDSYNIASRKGKVISSKKEYKSNLIYLPVGIDVITDLEEIILKYFNTMFRLHNKRIDEITLDLREKIDNLFEGFDLTFNFSRLDIDDSVYFKNKNNEEFSAENLSTGEKTLLSKVLYLSLKDVKNKIILIDEPELSLHPMWQERILAIYEKFAKDNNNQIIIATHSPHIIGSAKNESIRVLREIDGKIEVINDVTAYGRDVKWVLKEVMGSEYTRSQIITTEIERCQILLDNEEYQKVEKCINHLERRIGQDDRDLMDLRNSLFFERD